MLEPDGEGPVPASWRPTITSLVETLVRPDLRFGTGVAGVEPMSDEVLAQCRYAVEAYGDVTLVSLSDETWGSSVCRWASDHWDCLVDLWTAE